MLFSAALRWFFVAFSCFEMKFYVFSAHFSVVFGVVFASVFWRFHFFLDFILNIW